MKFILATTNKNKLSEINAIAKDYGINFELPQIPFEVDEDGETLYENALKKAEFLVGRSRANANEPNGSKLNKQNNFCILSDDTGLFVEALDGAPGIHSARYDTTPEKRIQKLLNALKNENSFGKTEMWYVISALEGAGLYVGFKEDENKENVEKVQMGLIRKKMVA